MSGVAELNPPATVAAQPAEERDKTIPEVCEKRGFSIFFYYQLKKRGFGPRETRYPGSPAVRISAEALREWDQKLEEWARTEAAELENQRRIEQRKVAGKKAAESATHVSNAGPRISKGQTPRRAGRAR